MVHSQISRRLLLNRGASNDQVEFAVYLELLGEQIWWRRNQLFNMSQEDLAKATGLGQSRVSRIETGALDLRFRSLLKLSAVLQTTPHDLLPPRVAVVTRARDVGYQLPQ